MIVGRDHFKLSDGALAPTGLHRLRFLFMLDPFAKRSSRLLVAVGFAFSLCFFSVERPAFAQEDQARPTPRLTPRLRPRATPAAPTASPTSRSPQQSKASAPAPSSPAHSSISREKPPPVATGNDGKQAPTPAPVQISSAASLQSPPLLPAFKKLPPPPGYVDFYRTNTPLVISGSITLGITYLVSVIQGATNNFKNGTGNLAVPILGPWLAIGSRDVDCKVVVSGDVRDPAELRKAANEATQCFTREAAAIAVMTGMGIGQLIGATLIVAGIIDRRHFYLREDVAGISITPTLDPENLGFRLQGSF